MRKRTLIGYFVALLLAGCGESQSVPTDAPGGKLVFEDGFDGTILGEGWRDTSSGKYTIVDGRLRVQGARNKPLWLTRPLPRDARIEFDACSMSTAVDIKVELYGDGKSFAKELSYTATSYVAILGGWNNSRSIIARLNEHGDDRVTRTSPRAQASRTYHFSIARKGNKIRWALDGQPFMEMNDPEPLEGEGHRFFAVNNWESEVFFDDLKVFEL